MGMGAVSVDEDAEANADEGLEVLYAECVGAGLDADRESEVAEALGLDAIAEEEDGG